MIASEFGVELWLPCPLWPAYDVSNLGNVRRRTRGPGTFVGRLKRRYAYEDRRTGYWAVFVCLPGRASGSRGCRRVKVAQLVAATWHGPRRGRLVRHLNDDTFNNRACNLRYGSAADNARDRARNRQGVAA